MCHVIKTYHRCIIDSNSHWTIAQSLLWLVMRPRFNKPIDIRCKLCSHWVSSWKHNNHPLLGRLTWQLARQAGKHLHSFFTLLFLFRMLELNAC